MEAGHPPTDSQVARVPTQRTPPEQVAPGPAAPPPAPRRFRWGLVLGVIAGALALLCVAGATVVYVAYDRYTRPDRSAPDVVVDNYLRSYLVYRNDVQAGQYACEDQSGLAPLRQARVAMTERERELQTTFDVTWGPLDQSIRDDAADVTVQVTMTNWVNTLAYSSHQSWRFGTRRIDGEWWVCQATRLD